MPHYIPVQSTLRRMRDVTNVKEFLKRTHSPITSWPIKVASGVRLYVRNETSETIPAGVAAEVSGEKIYHPDLAPTKFWCIGWVAKAKELTISEGLSLYVLDDKIFRKLVV